MRKRFNNTIALGIVQGLLLAACSSPSAIHIQQQPKALPEAFLNIQKTAETQPLDRNLPFKQVSERLSQLTNSALSQNASLMSKRAGLQQSEQSVVVAGSAQYPSLSLDAGAGRYRSKALDDAAHRSQFDLMLQGRYELDVWQKLSKQKQQAQLRYASLRADYYYQSTLLAANVQKAWIMLVEAEQLLALYERRVVNLRNNLDRIEGAYRLGLSESLDVYLARNDVHTEDARIAVQKQTVLEKSQALEKLLGQYPSGKTVAKSSFPTPNQFVSINTPSEQLTKRLDLESAWLTVMAKDAGVAIAHKARFPQFVLTGNGGYTSDDFSHWLSAGPLVASLIGNMTAPLFMGFRLKAEEQAARFELKASEATYIDNVQTAFQQTEARLSQQKQLKTRLDALKKAKSNALSAESISFEQYMTGIVDYSLVLESQRRAFDTQQAVIQAESLWVQNALDLYVALGGQYQPETGWVLD